MLFLFALILAFLSIGIYGQNCKNEKNFLFLNKKNY